MSDCRSVAAVSAVEHSRRFGPQPHSAERNENDVSHATGASTNGAPTAVANPLNCAQLCAMYGLREVTEAWHIFPIAPACASRPHTFTCVPGAQYGSTITHPSCM